MSDTISRPGLPTQRVSDLLRLFFRVSFLASPPQAIPAGERPFYIGLTLALLSYVLALAFDFGMGYATARAVLDIAATGLLLWVCLRLTGRQARFQQAYGAYCGAVSFANLAALVIYRSGAQSAEPSMALGDFVLLVWNLCLLGHVIRHTFELRMVPSLAAALFYVFLITNLLFRVMPLPSA